MFKEVFLTGTPYEKGFTYGSQCRAEVLRSIEDYSFLFQDRQGYSWEEAKAIARRFLPALTGKYQPYVEEMQGIADGAGVTFDDILTLNCRTEVIYSAKETPKEAPDECTAFSALSCATADGITLAGQSWDYILAQREACVIVRFPAEGNIPARLMFLEAGMVGGKGVNSAGLSLTLNALHTELCGSGVPLHIRMRRVLDCRYLDDAFSEAAVMPIPCAANLIITHRDDISLSLELDPSGCDVIQPWDGIIVHTNHYYGPRMVLTHQHLSTGSTYIRWQMLDRLLRSGTPLTLHDVEAAYRNHQGFPKCICVHPHPDLTPEERLMASVTNYAFIADLTHGKVYLAQGNPCESEFVEIPIEK